MRGGKLGCTYLVFCHFFVDSRHALSFRYDYSYGTHVAGIAAGNGLSSKGRYTGIAPECNIVAVKILDKDGRGNSSDVLGGLQWVLDNKDRYNIRIINLSIGTADIGSADPLVRAVEAAWDMGIVVVIAAGNRGPSTRTVTSPGTSRKVITAGASDDEPLYWLNISIKVSLNFCFVVIKFISWNMVVGNPDFTDVSIITIVSFVPILIF